MGVMEIVVGVKEKNSLRGEAGSRVIRRGTVSYFISPVFSK